MQSKVSARCERFIRARSESVLEYIHIYIYNVENVNVNACISFILNSARI